MASTNGLQNNALVVNTIDGLTTLYATSIYDNGQAVDPGSYVPYTGALFNVDLNNNQLNDVNSLQVNSSIAAASLTTTGLITTNTLKINSVPSGTQTNLLAVDSSGNVIQGSSPTQIQINAGLTNGTPYYLTFVPSNTGLAKNESLYTEAYYNGYEIQYSPLTQTLSVLNMDIEGQVKIPNLASASPSYYVGINATNQMVKVSAVSAQPNITQASLNITYYPVFVNSNSAQSGATIFVDGQTSPLAYTFATQTVTCKNLQVSGSTIINGYALLASPVFTGAPTAPTAATGSNNLQLATTAFVQNTIAALTGFIATTGTTTGVNNIIKLAGTSAQFIIQSSTGGALLSVRQSATPYVGIDSLNVTNALAVGTTSTFTGAITASSDLTVTGTVYGVSYAGSLLANMVFNSPGGGRNIVFQYAGTPILTLNASGGSAVFYNGLVYADAGAGALILGVNGSPASNVALSTTSATFNAPIQASFVDNTSNDGVGIWVSSGGTQSSSIVLTDTFGKTIGTATPTTSFGRYFAVGGAVYQDFYGAFNWRATNTLGATTWSTVSGVMKLTTSNLGLAMGSMFNFSVAGTWDAANCLYVTSGGMGGTTSGVGLGYSTTDSTGYLVSIAPNVTWQNMSYKSASHYFYAGGNTLMAGVNTTGLFANNAGYMTNSVGAAAAGLSAGYSSGDLIFYANSSQVMRFYTGTTCKIAMGANSIYLDTIRNFSTSATNLLNDNGFNVYNSAQTLPYFSSGSGGNYFYVNGSLSAYNSNAIYSPALGAYTARGFFLTAAGGAGCYPAICYAWNNPGAGTSGSTYCTSMATSSQYTVYLPNPVSGIYGFAYNWGATGFAFPSDRRLKDGITPLEDCTEIFMKLNPCHYYYKADKEKRIRHGFMAQEIQELFPDAVTESEITETDEAGNKYKHLQVCQTDLIPVMVKQIQTQQQTITAMAQHITTLTDTLNALLAKYPI